MALAIPALFAIIFTVSTCAYLYNNPKHRAVLSERLGRLSFSSPRPFQPLGNDLGTKKGISNTSKPTYVNAFPPCGREAFRDTYDELPESLKVVSADQGAFNTSDPSTWKHLPFDQKHDEVAGDCVTPTGFTVDEIRKLGDFPDYSKLGGVPLPEAYEGFDIDQAIARPYRPFRWKYFQTMSLNKLEPNWWLELTSKYRSVIQQRKAIHERVGPLVLQALPGSDLHCKELMEHALQFLCARYPKLFTLSANKTQFQNHILHTETNLKTTHPLHVLLENVPEDFAVMIRNPEDGIYYFRAGVICSALGWSLGHKIGKPLAGVHEPVPHFKEKMQFSMDRYFSKMPTNAPIQRGSWGVEVDEPLFMPPGDPHEEHRNYQMDPSKLAAVSPPPPGVEHGVTLRVDWQTLRRLPLTGAIIFNFKGLFSSLEEFRDEPYVPKLCLKVLEEGDAEILKYKGSWHVEHVVKPWLREWVKEQEEKGMVPVGWEEHTLEESPLFPGWEESWRKRQGF